MEKRLKLTAILLTLSIVVSFYPAIAWNWFTHPVFWLIYILSVTADLWCIKRLKKMQSFKSK